MQIMISDIKINPGRRQTSLETVAALAESIRTIGLLNPITLDNQKILIAGLHRLEAAKQLGWSEIECTISSLEGLQAELAEIDENFVRNDLSALEFGELLLRRKEIYETLHPTSKQGGDRKSPKIKTQNLPFDPVKSFVQDTADKLGVSRRTVQNRIQTAKSMTPKVKQVLQQSGTKISKEDALKLSRLDEQQQEEAAAQLAAGHIKNMDQFISEQQQNTASETQEGSPLSQHACVQTDTAPFHLPDKQYQSFAESVADLKNPDKDCRCTPDIFLAEFSEFIRKFLNEIQWYGAEHYESIFPAITPAQLDYLRQQTDALCTAAKNLFRQVERNASQ